MSSPVNGPDLEVARRLSAAAGLNIPDGRLSTFAASLAANSELVRPLMSIDYGAAEPASRFHAPPMSK